MFNKKIKNVLLNEYKEFALKNKDLSPEIRFIPLTEKQNGFRYVGAQIFENCLYSIVNGAEKMLKYNLTNGNMEFLGMFDESDFKWSGGCIYNGKLLSFPRLKNNILTYSPAKNEFGYICGDFMYNSEHHYGGVITENDIIYQPPRNTNHILKWDLKNNTCEKIYINDNQSCRYCGSVIHPNGYIYFVPERGSKIIKMNTKTEEITYIGGIIEAMVFNPVVAVDGNIYGFSSNSGLLKITVQEDKVSFIHKDTSIGSYGTKPGINGKLYSLPGYTNDIWEFDVFKGQLKRFGMINSEKSCRYAGGAVNLNGDIYALPVHEDNIMVIDFSRYNVNVPKELYNTFFKEFY